MVEGNLSFFTLFSVTCATAILPAVDSERASKYIFRARQSISSSITCFALIGLKMVLTTTLLFSTTLMAFAVSVLFPLMIGNISIRRGVSNKYFIFVFSISFLFWLQTV